MDISVKKYNKILLIDPLNNFFEQSNPIAILDVAPYLRMRGIDVDVCILGNFIDKKYDIVAVSCIGNYGNTIFEQLIQVANYYKDTKIVVGGKWTGFMTDEEKLKLDSLGILYTTEKAELYFTGESVIDFENYPSWDKNDFDILNKLFSNTDNISYMMTLRGCPFKCNFCHNTENKISYFTAKRTVDNIELLLEKGCIVFFVDDVFVVNYEHAKSIYDECVKRGIDIRNRNIFFVHLNTVNEKSLDIIK